MDMDSCLAIENFKKQIIDLINNSDLSIGMLMYLLADLQNEITLMYKKTLKEEQNHSENHNDLKVGNIQIQTDDNTPKDLEIDLSGLKLT